LIRLVYVEATWARADRERSLAALQVARRRLTERAAAIGDPELREKFLLGVPENAITLALARERLGD
jgi:hypothetical protein